MVAWLTDIREVIVPSQYLVQCLTRKSLWTDMTSLSCY